jgi:glycosyltransferase involved in cell wall biosynthesis
MQMKVLVMNTADVEGGAARCAHRLHNGLRNANIDSVYFVQKKWGHDDDVLTSKSWMSRFMADFRPGIDRIPMRLYPNRQRSPFSTGLMSSFNTKSLLKIKPDIINLHYIGEGFLPIRSLSKMQKPIVWTLHDSWPFTGGCHLPGNCNAYEKNCGNCPILGSHKPNDLSHWILQHKKRQWHDLNITIATGSNWLAECARKSALFRDLRIEAINPGLDLKTYTPIDRVTARSILNLPQDKKLILFGAMHSTKDSNKGFQFLHPAVAHLAKSELGTNTEVVVFGSAKPNNAPDFGVPTHYLGRLHDDISLAVLYSAADVMVVPSIRESFGQTASESMSCGTPVVAFGATGLLDIVTHKYNGYLATPYSHLDLADGIKWILSQNEIEMKILRNNARETARVHFSIELMTKKYLNLFDDVLKKN